MSVKGVSVLLILGATASAWSQQPLPRLEIANPLSRSPEVPDGQMVTKESTIRLNGTAHGVSGIQRITWESDRGIGGYAILHDTRVALAIRWETEPISLRPGRNRIKVQAVDSSNQAATSFVFIDYVPEETQRPEPQQPPQTSRYRGKAVTYQVKSGRAIYQGDIILGPVDETGAMVAPAPPLSPRVSTQGSTAAYAAALWPSVGGVVQIPYAGTINGNIAAAITSFNQTFAGMIQWVPLASQVNYVSWSLNTADHTGTCEANVGMSGGVQTVGGSIDCATSTLLHEMGHTIGLWHEQSRMDRNSYVTVIYANIDKPLESNFDQVLSNEVDSGLYDFGSIMHYGYSGFSKFGNAPTLESNPAGIPLSNTLGYTTGDIDAIKRLYGLTPSSVTIDSNPSGAQVLVDSVLVTTPHTFTWSLNSIHSLDLPADPQMIVGQLHIFGRWNNQPGTARITPITISPGGNTVNAPNSAPAVTVYTANFIPIYQYSLSSSTTNGTSTANPLPALTFNGKNYFTNRQLISLTAAPNAGFSFFEWFNISLFNLYANPNNLYVLNDLVNTQPDFLASPILTVAFNGSAIPSTGIFPSPAIMVDSNVINAPQNFTWSSPHTLNAPLSTEPVTTNIPYLFGNWSDGGGPTHTVNRPGNNTSQTITANYVAEYRTLVTANPTCASTLNPVQDSFIQAGGGDTLGVTPISGYTFVGWSKDLSGTANPLSVTILDELLAVANFNLTGTTAPLAITSISPPSVPATASAQDLTITGTGFTNGGNATYGFWNNTFHALIYNSSTSVTLHLNAGEALAPGFYDIQLGNSANSCIAFTDYTYPVTISAANPMLTISKMHTGNFTQGQNGVFTVTVSNAANANATSGTATVTEAPGFGLAVASMSGTGWNCPPGGVTCTRSNSLPGGMTYPAITVTVNVALNALLTATNQVTVSGGGSALTNATDTVTVANVPAQLKFLVQPVNGVVGTPLTAVQVQVVDANASPVTTSTASITLTSIPPNVTSTVAAVNGVATFNNLVFTSSGPYSLSGSSPGLSSASSNSFTITGALPSVTIESPASGATVSTGTAIVSGWALDNTSSAGTAISGVQVLIDGITIGNAAYGIARADICNTYPGRPGCPNVGFLYSVSTALLTPGSHTITVTATDSDGTPDMGTASVNITVAPLLMTGSKAGVFRAGSTFLLDSNGDGIPDMPDRYLTTFVPPGGVKTGDIGVVGDWTGDGHTKVGYYRPSTGTWWLDANNNGIFDAGDYQYAFGGIAGDTPVVGDWAGLGKSCIGIFRYGAYWLLDLNCNGIQDAIPPDAYFGFGGLTGDVPVVGAWTGGKTRVGVVRTYSPQGLPLSPPFLWVRDSADADAGNSSSLHQPMPGSYGFGGLQGDVFVTGDWLKTGVSRSGVYRNGLWVLDANGLHNPDLILTYGGLSTDVPVVGNW